MIIKDKEKLYDLYINQYKTQQEIADFFSCQRYDVKNSLDHYHIPRRPRTRKVPLTIQKQIADEYLSGISMQDLTNKYNVSSGTIRQYVIESGGTMRTKGNKLFDPPLEEIKKDYLEFHLSTQDIADKYGYTWGMICNYLRSMGVERQSQCFYSNPNFKEDYWETIDSPIKAYFLGLLITDGNVRDGVNSKSGYEVRLGLKTEDKYILEKLCLECGIDNKLTYDPRATGLYTLHIKNKKWVEDLSKYGVVPDKTWKTYLPKCNYMSSLIRGCIDGDGWIDRNQRIGICGNDRLVKGIHNYLINVLKVSSHKITYPKGYNGPFAHTRWAGKEDVKKIGNFLYSDNTDFYLIRKYNNIKNYL